MDRPSIVTLRNPESHSVHCLVDIRRCVDSDYEVLDLNTSNDANTTGLHGRVLRVDGAGSSALRRLAQQHGRDCSTCDGGGTITQGFAASVFGVVRERSAADAQQGIPPTMIVTDVRLEACQDLALEDDTVVLYEPDADSISYVSGSVGTGLDPIVVHGGLMAAAWGFLLPLGVLTAALRRRADADDMWFKIHRACNMLGCLFTFVGIAVAFAKFDNVFQDGMGPSYRHGSMGITVASLAAVQVINALLRPHKEAPAEPHVDDQKEEGEGEYSNNNENDGTSTAAAATAQTVVTTTKRRVWEVVHKFLGYSAFGLAYPTMYFGSQVAGLRQQLFERVFYGAIGLAVFFSASLVRSNYFGPHQQGVKNKREERSIAISQGTT